jgi:UrcA family protein
MAAVPAWPLWKGQTMSIKLISVSLAALGLAAAGVPALAQPYGSDGRYYDSAPGDAVGEVVITGHYAPDVEVKSKVVNYADLDLSSDYGARTLMRRISGAARMVCSPPSDRQLADAADYQNCRADAEARAVDDVGVPTLTAYYQYRR